MHTKTASQITTEVANAKDSAQINKIITEQYTAHGGDVRFVRELEGATLYLIKESQDNSKTLSNYQAALAALKKLRS